MHKSHKRAIVFCMIAVSVIIFYVRTVPQVSLTERAIVLGLGIDKVEGGYTLTMEIVNPKSQGAENEQDDSYIIAKGTGDTLSDAIDEISQKTGLTVSLSQCNILILGENILSATLFPALTYLIESYGIPEQSLLLVSKGSAEALLKTKPLLTSISAMQISNAMHTSLDSVGVVSETLKDFFEGYLSKSNTSPIAYIEAKKVDNSEVGGDDGNYYEYDYSKCAIFSKSGGMLFDSDVTTAFNYVKTKLNKGNECISYDGVSFDLSLFEKKYKEEISLKDGRIQYKGEISGRFYIVEAENIDKYFGINDISDDTLTKVEETLNNVIRERIINVFLKCREDGFDIFGIADRAYSFIGKDALSVLEQDDYLFNIDIIINSNITVEKK